MDPKELRTEVYGPQSFKEENDGDAQGSEQEVPGGGHAMMVERISRKTQLC